MAGGGSEVVPRFPNGDRKYPSHIELEHLCWNRGDHKDRPCSVCGKLCEWWEKAPRGSGEYALFERRTTINHTEKCRLR